MMLPAEKTKNPRIQPMISTTAIRYNILLIKNCFNYCTIKQAAYQKVNSGKKYGRGNICR